MNNKEKVTSDIVFILEKLLNHLRTKNQLGILLSSNVNLLTEKLYNLYSFDYRFESLVADAVDCTIHPAHKTRAEQEFRVYYSSLNDAKFLCLEALRQQIFYKSAPQSNGWIYSDVADYKKYESYIGGRIYINCAAEALPLVISEIIKKVKQEMEADKTCSFCSTPAKPYAVQCFNCDNLLPRVYPLRLKFIDPQSLKENEIAELFRPEKIVLYIYPWPNLLREITNWLLPLQGSFYDEVPLFAKKLSKGIGYAPEPKAEQKSLYENDGGNRKSFGQILCFLIAKVFANGWKQEEFLEINKNYLKLLNLHMKRYSMIDINLNSSLGCKVNIIKLYSAL